MRAAVAIVFGATLMVHGQPAHATTVNRCLARKITNVGASFAARERCYARDTAKPDAAAFDRCSSAASRKFTGYGVPIKGAFGAAEQHPPCVTYGDQATLDEAIAVGAGSLDAAMGALTLPSRCDAAKLECLAKYVINLTRCHAKAATSGVLDEQCLAKGTLRLANGVNGCLDQAEARRPNCTLLGDAQALEAVADQFVTDALCALDSAGTPGCPPMPTSTLPTPTPGPPTPSPLTPTPTLSSTATPTPLRTRTATPIRTRTPTPMRTPTPTQTGAVDAAQVCVDRINQYRASIGRPPYERWTAAENCANAQALADGTAQSPHSEFGRCGEWAQNECPGFGAPARMIITCLQLMWSEGPGQDLSHGHYINMASAEYTKVACGFGVLPNGEVWATEDFE